MRKVLGPAAAVAMLLAVAVTASAQFGHPLKGTWSADWSPSAGKTTHVLVELNWDGKTITGTVNPGVNGVAIGKATLDAVWSINNTSTLSSAAGGALPNTGVGLLGQNKSGEVVVRLQFQVMF